MLLSSLWGPRILCPEAEGTGLWVRPWGGEGQGRGHVETCSRASYRVCWLTPSRPLHIIETDAAAGRVLNEGCSQKQRLASPRGPAKGQQRHRVIHIASTSSLNPEVENVPAPGVPRMGGQDCAWLIFKRVTSWSRGDGGPPKAVQSLTLRTREHDLVWKNVFADRVKSREEVVLDLGWPCIRCPASLQEKGGGALCTDPQGAAKANLEPLDTGRAGMTLPRAFVLF